MCLKYIINGIIDLIIITSHIHLFLFLGDLMRINFCPVLRLINAIND